ncbi:polysaccharide deacetylase family protein [Cupriavidus sp. L7L]|uniref:polysaccharide deacetylase family protein n=1 Tax=Cupriavidus sp. L7L TaxID=2546443 RepID=UPI001FB65F86|nr:polysaccharide deacetylase family protein [Cupriavidus sp. L7L]
MKHMTEETLSWLQRILAERFGHGFQLQGTDAGFVRLSLAGSGEGSIEIAADPVTFKRADSALAFTTWDALAEGWQTALRGPLPAPGLARAPSPLIESTPAGYRIHYDVLGLCYWMLSRQEEVGRTDLDKYRRFPASGSHAHRHGYLERPVVDEWLHILGQVIRRQWPELQLRQLRPGMKVSHDVDVPSRYGFGSAARMLRRMAGDILIRRDVRSVLQAPVIRMKTRTALHPGDRVNTFDWIMDVSERHGLVSAFYFICGRTHPGMDADYEPEHPAIRGLMQRIHARGHEIGLHPSFNTYQAPGAVQAEAIRLRRVCEQEKIEQEVWGGRMHYLRWEHPTTMLGWEQAGMTYDSTLSYADHAGFRCGTCFEYPAFDPVAGKALNLRIRPLIAMEGTVMGYMGLGTGEAAWSKFRELKDTCNAVNGCFTMLWHNSSLGKAEERELYQAVVAH